MGWNVYVTRLLPKPGMDLLYKSCEVVDVNPHDRMLTRQEFLDNIKGRDGVITLLTERVDEEACQVADKTVIFANYAVGFNNIDVPTCTKHGILVSNTPGVLTDATSDMAWALLFSVARRIVESDKFLRAGKYEGWAPMMYRGGDIVGKTLGICGAGRIGSAMAMKSRGWNMKVLYCDLYRNESLEKELGAKQVDKDTLLKESDFVSLHVSLDAGTKHYIGERELRMMKPTAYLVNTSRGPVIDEQALVHALREGWIAGAGLDVFEYEPLLMPGLAGLDNAVICPHVASATMQTRDDMATLAAQNLIAALKGEKPPTLVNADALNASNRRKVKK
ncbi:MAG: D-glycerate dehydrogenase [Candidatus Latescibacteria bacterium]|nr:D-glycerate dehydrogenase [Candidatus Latescibacterota bacterium]